jgi:hypothetical protein
MLACELKAMGMCFTEVAFHIVPAAPAAVSLYQAGGLDSAE